MNMVKAKGLIAETGKKFKKGFSRDNVKRGIIVLASLGIMAGRCISIGIILNPGNR